MTFCSEIMSDSRGHEDNMLTMFPLFSGQPRGLVLLIVGLVQGDAVPDYGGDEGERGEKFRWQCQMGRVDERASGTLKSE